MQIPPVMLTKLTKSGLSIQGRALCTFGFGQVWQFDPQHGVILYEILRTRVTNNRPRGEHV